MRWSHILCVLTLTTWASIVGADANAALQKTNDASTTANQQGTQQSTPSIKQQPISPSPQTPVQQQNRQDRNRWLDPVVLVTIAAVVVYVVILYVYFRQLVEMRKSADAARDYARIASDTAQRQLRAYVNVDSAAIDLTHPAAPKATVVFKNFGHTPAYDVQIWIHMWIEVHPLAIDLPTPPANFRMGKDILAPGRPRISQITKYPPVSPEAVPLLGTPQGTIYVYGEVRYRDAFGNDRWTKYRLIWGGPEGVPLTSSLQADSEGNEAN